MWCFVFNFVQKMLQTLCSIVLHKNKLCSMTCGGESKKEKITGDSEASWLISYYDFRVGCDPLVIRKGDHTEIIMGKSCHWSR